MKKISSLLILTTVFLTGAKQLDGGTFFVIKKITNNSSKIVDINRMNNDWPKYNFKIDPKTKKNTSADDYNVEWTKWIEFVEDYRTDGVDQIKITIGTGSEEQKYYLRQGKMRHGGSSHHALCVHDENNNKTFRIQSEWRKEKADFPNEKNIGSLEYIDNRSIAGAFQISTANLEITINEDESISFRIFNVKVPRDAVAAVAKFLVGYDYTLTVFKNGTIKGERKI